MIHLLRNLRNTRFGRKVKFFCLFEKLYAHNALKYRGYYHDAETGFYYLNSRYYDPEVGRFINIDNMISGDGNQLYAACIDININGYGGAVQIGSESAIAVHLKDS